jgi:hypothetical protein
LLNTGHVYIYCLGYNTRDAIFLIPTIYLLFGLFLQNRRSVRRFWYLQLQSVFQHYSNGFDHRTASHAPPLGQLLWFYYAFCVIIISLFIPPLLGCASAVRYFLMGRPPYGLHIRRTGHNRPSRSSTDGWALTTINAAGTNGLCAFRCTEELEIINCLSPIR